jgi:hypothetical protein
MLDLLKVVKIMFIVSNIYLMFYVDAYKKTLVG